MTAQELFAQDCGIGTMVPNLWGKTADALEAESKRRKAK